MRTLLLLLSMLLLIGCSSTRVQHGIPNLVVVTNGVWRGGQPNTEGWQWLKAQGVRSVVKLNTDSEGSDAYGESLGIAVNKFPIDFKSQALGPVDGHLIGKAAGLVKTNTFVHCEHGQDRTGLVIATYRVQHGWPKQKAEDEMLKLGFHRKTLHGLWEAWENLK